MDKKDILSKFKAIIAGMKKSGSEVSENDGSDHGFGVTVRSSEPILRVTETADKRSWLRDLPGNIATGLLLISVISIYCVIIDEPLLILFACPALLIFTAFAVLESMGLSKIRYIAFGVAALLLLAAVIIWHQRIGAGFALMMDEFYDAAEEAQAYIYDRLPGSDEASGADTRIAMVWIASLAGILMAAVPARHRSVAGIALTAAVMLALAYYGVLPSTVCAGAMLAALLLTISKDNVPAALPLLLITALFFGAVALIDPGENYGISRMNENVRDRIAFRSALIQDENKENEDAVTYDGVTDAEEAGDSALDEESGSSYLLGGIILLIAAAIGAAAYFQIKRFRSRRAAVRRGLDSSDPREAVTALFPYSVRWLKASGIETREAPFSAMSEDIRRVYDNRYARRFNDMYSLWREAAYSDHDITEADKAEMERFSKDTIDMISDKFNAAQRIMIKYKHAL